MQPNPALRRDFFYFQQGQSRHKQRGCCPLIACKGKTNPVNSQLEQIVIVLIVDALNRRKNDFAPRLSSH
jgi:hypothetical protein